MSMKNSKYKVIVTTPEDKDIVKKCEKIAFENNVENGGTLRFLGLVGYADYIMYCTCDDKVVGFAALNENFAYKNDIYILQIAVKKEFQNQGVGTELFEYLFHHSKQYRCITSNVKKGNESSLKLHKKFGFILMNLDGEHFDLIARPKKIFNKDLRVTKKVQTKELSL